MKKMLIILLSVIFLLAYSQNGEKNFIDQNYIEVIGKSEMHITPDEIYLKIIINEKDTKNKISVAELEKRMMKKLQEIGIDVSKNLKIKNLVSDFRFDAIFKKDILLKKEYRLIVNNGITATKVYIELENIGISNITIDKLDHSEIEKYRREVKIEGIKAAKDKATAMVEAINQEIGRAFYIKELSRPNYYNQKASNTALYMMSDQLYKSSEIDIDFEKIKLEYSVLVRFELK